MRTRRWRPAGGFFPALLACLAAGGLHASPRERVVALDGSGQYRSVQAAIDGVVAGGEATTLRLGAGTWREVVDVPAGAPPIALVGAGSGRTRLVFDNHASRIDPRTGKPFGTFASATVTVRADDFSAAHLTIANDAGPVGQAVALAVVGTRAAFRDVRFLGHQDTLYLQGHDSLSWFGGCEVHGTVDFIFGAGTALFEDCRIHSVGNGYVTAAATPRDHPHGLVFRDCTLTAAEGVDAVYLGRPWRDHARVAFLDSELGAHILAAGWHDWGRPERQASAFFAEAGNRGAGAATAGRVPWSHALPPAQASTYSREAILGHWRPFEWAP
ncbi:pectinesterase family protein [Pseudoxanthomonas sp. 10H]|uniref:pectinesterase family protein n=1 Tax=Pseudoxanthomonas sp. 10H TaxID=3242729 RepID=UPI003556791E